MTDFSRLDSALHESTPESIAAALRYLRKADAVMAALAPMFAAQQPAALAVPEAAALVQKWREQANAALRRSGTWNGNDMADRIERMADELAAMLAAAERAKGVDDAR